MRKSQMRANLLRAGLPLPGASRGPQRALPQPEVKLEAVVLRAPRPASADAAELVARAHFPWRTDPGGSATGGAAATGDGALLVLDARMRIADLAAAARALCVANRVLPHATPEETLRDLLDVSTLTLPGGVAFVVDGARVVTPGCCVGVESWRGWSDLLETGCAPWGGHDPFASAAAVHREVHVYADAGAPPRLVLERGAYRSLLLDVERDLLHFVRRFEGWLVETAPGVAHALAAKVGRDLRIVKA